MDLVLVVKVIGLVGVSASLSMVVVDIMLYGRSDSFKKLPPLKRAVGLPLWRLRFANALGVALIPVAALGFIPLYFVLLPAGFYWSMATVGLFMYFMWSGVGAHASTSDQYLLHRSSDEGNGESDIYSRVVVEQDGMQNSLAWLVRMVYLLASIMYTAIVLTGKTNFPIWMSVVNPFIFTAFAIYSYRFLPSKIAGYLYPIKVYFGILPLQILTLIFIWNLL